MINTIYINVIMMYDSIKYNNYELALEKGLQEVLKLI